jgi:hypothetical protein
MAGRDLLRKAVPAWRAAQAQAKTLLDKDHVIAITNIANYIMDHPTPSSNTT